MLCGVEQKRSQHAYMLFMNQFGKDPDAGGSILPLTDRLKQGPRLGNGSSGQ
jgi:hypothetical protein